jgi:preprotein translocase subunit YajC
VLDFFISPAYAQAADQPSAFITFMPLVLLMVVFYFLLIRPQMKRNKEHRQLIEKLALNDEVITSGGIAGRVTGLGETFISVELADGVTVKVQRAAVSSVLPKGTLKSA